MVCLVLSCKSFGRITVGLDQPSALSFPLCNRAIINRKRGVSTVAGRSASTFSDSDTSIVQRFCHARRMRENITLNQEEHKSLSAVVITSPKSSESIDVHACAKRYLPSRAAKIIKEWITRGSCFLQAPGGLALMDRLKRVFGTYLQKQKDDRRHS